MISLFSPAAFARSRGLIEQIFASFSGIAEQALFIEDLFDFFRTKPSIASKPECSPGAEANSQRIRVSRCLVCLSRLG